MKAYYLTRKPTIEYLTTEIQTRCDIKNQKKAEKYIMAALMRYTVIEAIADQVGFMLEQGQELEEYKGQEIDA